MDHETVVAYLDRVGVTAPAASDAAGRPRCSRDHFGIALSRLPDDPPARTV